MYSPFKEGFELPETTFDYNVDDDNDRYNVNDEYEDDDDDGRDG